MSPQPKPRVASSSFIIYPTPKDLVIVVSKKVAPKAVDRNRIKRLIKESLRSMDLGKSLKIIVKKNVADAKMLQIKDELAALLK